MYVEVWFTHVRVRVTIYQALSLHMYALILFGLFGLFGLLWFGLQVVSNRRHFQDYLLKSLNATTQLRQSETTLDAELSRCGVHV